MGGTFSKAERARGPHLFLIFVRLFAPTTPPLFRAGISTQAQGPIARQPGLSDAKRALPSLTAPPSDPTPRATHNRRPLQTLVTFCAPTHEPSRFSPQTTTTTTTPRAPPPPYPSSPERLPFGLDFFGFSLRVVTPLDHLDASPQPIPLRRPLVRPLTPPPAIGLDRHWSTSKYSLPHHTTTKPPRRHGPLWLPEPLPGRANGPPSVLAEQHPPPGPHLFLHDAQPTPDRPVSREPIPHTQRCRLRVPRRSLRRTLPQRRRLQRLPISPAPRPRRHAHRMARSCHALPL